jgi:hypothetical protein
VPGYVSFIDLGGLKQRSHNGGDYKLGIVASVSFWSQESILVRLRPRFTENSEGTAIYPSLYHECGVLAHMRLRPPFIENSEGTAIYPSLHHECGVLAHMTGPHIC